MLLGIVGPPPSHQMNENVAHKLILNCLILLSGCCQLLLSAPCTDDVDRVCKALKIVYSKAIGL